MLGEYREQFGPGILCTGDGPDSRATASCDVCTSVLGGAQKFLGSDRCKCEHKDGGVLHKPMKKGG